MQTKDHWEQLYASKAPDELSWFQPHAALSLRLIRTAGLPADAAIIDVGGGASTLADDLLANGYCSLTVLDVSASALAAARKRLGSRADAVQWIEADVTQFDFPWHAFDLWHDRAVFHFLTAPEQRQAYVKAMLQAVKPGGLAIVATFADDGPNHCSGLPVMRYSASTLQAELGNLFTLLGHEKEEHHTPSGSVQKFVYCVFRKAQS